MNNQRFSETEGYLFDSNYIEETKKMEKKAKWSEALKWVEDIPISSGLALYPLQLANAIRIIKNDAVFIFDEVGCGKTLSAGIMAKSYLWQNKNRICCDDILVITTNTVKLNGQFKKDWIKIDERLEPTVYNNLISSDLKKLSNKRKWGLVVIDEAHEFSNTDTARYNKLKNDLRADKVVFLTATPLRGGGNFKFYKELADAILERQIDDNELKRISISESVEPQELICAEFDPTKPVTRYFKDTVKYLDIHEKKERAHRVIPELWYPKNGESREMTLSRNIDCKLTDNSKSRFVIFVRFKNEALRLEESLLKVVKAKISVVTVFADEKRKLEEYEEDKPDLPTVLILNYQIGEAGVNLPGYDHVIHWHISSDPVRLEQRYGRIDRMTSRHEKIYSCFVIPKDYDSNKRNLYSAIYYTMGELLTTLPARNVILTKDTLAFYKDVFDNKLNQYNEELNKYKSIDIDSLSDEELINIFKTADGEENGISDHKEFIEFIKEKVDNISWEENEGVVVLRETIQNEIDKQINRLNKKILKNDDECYIKSFAEKVKEIEDRSDQIFYSTEPCNPLSLKTIDSQDWGCAKYIQETEDYQLLQEIVKLLDAVREVMRCAAEDVLFASELFIKIGDLHYFTDELPEGMTPYKLAYTYTRFK